ncbi:MAG: adenosylcobinamide-GDP ribazoletransferase [Muribaculaceae bacterium]|nr:adenosylcobinamide-GDP ribazoletransferase [Muribaculaceae bacterium]
MKKLHAALIFFTRLPFWRLGEVPAHYYKRVVDCWSITGWLTGGIMAITLWLGSFIFPFPVAVILAFISRLLITGALHEDGMADFIDGMGGGTSRSRILEIMKDSHIGTYGVIGLIMYYLLAISLISSLPNAATACAVLFAGDAWSKCCAAQVINFLPYARKEEEAKNKTIYDRMSLPAFLISLIFGALPLLLLPVRLLPAAILPVIIVTGLIFYLKRNLQGYTGDCCGATFLFAELSFYFGVIISSHIADI